MSKWKEFIKLVPKGIKNADKIIEGIYNQVKLEKGYLSEDKVIEIVRRRVICGNCEFNSDNAKGYISDREDLHCSLCECNIEYKTACMKCNCGIETWNEENPKELKELKWTSYGS